jgi:guanine deaminase
VQLAREFPDLHIQTHLSENHAEIAFTRSSIPRSRDYTDVYEHYGLLGKGAVRPLHPSRRA